jgi:hypothetical protein
MSLRPQLNAVCGRCGKPRGLFHECVSNSRRKMTVRPQVTFGTCEKCRKTVTNPLTHVCKPRSDFRRRKTAHEREQRTAARKKRQQQAHDYTSCSDNDCKRALCVAFKRGWKGGDEAGYDRGWQQGYDRGFPDGIAACPRDHK